MNVILLNVIREPCWKSFSGLFMKFSFLQTRNGFVIATFKRTDSNCSEVTKCPPLCFSSESSRDTLVNRWIASIDKIRQIDHYDLSRGNVRETQNNTNLSWSAYSWKVKMAEKAHNEGNWYAMFNSWGYRVLY